MKPPQSDRPPFEAMSREELAKWYEQQVGYDPTEDDPTTTDEELLMYCSGYFSEIILGEEHN